MKQPLLVYPSFTPVPASQPAVLRSTPVVASSISKLGLKLISVQPKLETPVSTLGLFVPSGSRFETYHNRGASHVLQHLVFKVLSFFLLSND